MNTHLFIKIITVYTVGGGLDLGMVQSFSTFKKTGACAHIGLKQENRDFVPVKTFSLFTHFDSSSTDPNIAHPGYH